MRTICLALYLVAATATADTFALDPKQSELVVKTFKVGIASALAHNHVVRASEVSGELTWDPKDPEATKVLVTVQVAGLVADHPLLREKYGQPQPISEGDRKKVADAMLGESQLDLRKFPTISFASTALSLDAKGAMVIIGKLTLHGVTRDVKLPVKILAKDGRVEGDGVLRLRLSDFQVQPYSTALGAIRNQDEVELVLHLVGAKG